ncbi:MAG: hypothetical protein H7Z75_17810 [Ferruginibacter sp.]|nr:hypothetical protein [Cytophagales bacterium]
MHLIWGGGYRQRGFLSNRKYNRLTTGYVEDLLSGQYTNNRFDNLFLDFAVKFRRDQNSKVVPFLLVGNRLDCRLGFRSDFWGNDYRRLTRLEISPLFSAGLEIPLRRLTLGLGLEGAPVERITRLTFEFEFNPGIMNGHSGAGNEPGINGKTSPNPYGTKIPVGRIVRNQSFGFQAGLKF